MFTEAQNFLIVQTEVDAVFMQEFNGISNTPGLARATSAEIFKPIETTHAAWIQPVMAGSGLFSSIDEIQTVPMTSPRVTNKQTTYISTFAQSIELSKQMFDSNMHGVWSESVSNFGEVARLTQDNAAFALFRNGFTTALTADGSAIFSTHTLIKGGTQVNNGTASLSATSLNTAIVTLAEMKDQAGVVRGSAPAVLLVAPANFKHALEITQSALIADSANNNLNVYRSAYGITVYQSPYLGAVSGGSDTAWFLLARGHGFRRVIRQGIETALTPWQYSNNLTYRYQSNFREAYFCADYCGSYGSTGTV